VPLNEYIFTENDFSSSTVTGRPLPVAESLIQNDEETSEATDLSSINVTVFILPEIIRPHPKAGPRKEATKGRKRGKSKILTDTPQKGRNRETEDKKKKVGQGSRKKKATKQLFQDDSTSECDTDTELVMDDNEDYNTEFVGLTDLEDQENFERNKISKGDFVVVKLAGKKSVKYFVTEAIDLYESEL
jgi:hypothetical protein